MILEIGIRKRSMTEKNIHSTQKALSKNLCHRKGPILMGVRQSTQNDGSDTDFSSAVGSADNVPFFTPERTYPPKGASP